MVLETTENFWKLMSKDRFPETLDHSLHIAPLTLVLIVGMIVSEALTIGVPSIEICNKLLFAIV